MWIVHWSEMRLLGCNDLLLRGWKTWVSRGEHADGFVGIWKLTSHWFRLSGKWSCDLSPRECCHIRSKFSHISHISVTPSTHTLFFMKTNTKLKPHWPFLMSVLPVNVLLGVNLPLRFKIEEVGWQTEDVCTELENHSRDSQSLYLNNWRYQAVIVSVLGPDPQQMLNT